MLANYHILNGDALKEQFPTEIKGERIVVRECLVDGPVAGESLDELFKVRAQFISSNYSSCSTEDQFQRYSEEAYYRDTISEFEKISNIPAGANIHLWFEDDLFCQVNFWFVVSLLEKHHSLDSTTYLVRPNVHTPYGFGGLNQSELRSNYENSIQLKELPEIAKLWKFYQKGDAAELLKTANQLKEIYPLILPAVEAYIASIPTEDYIGRPAQSLLNIMAELKTEDFGTVFKEFCQREYIYGFGDLQVKRLLDQLKSKQ